ncbi:16S rRNA (uracil(1498)-N(3))-methyltransferase [Catelliglobosispora koreensis]|uniref:16S rRNA (uracil(1498)-N(3))-methyltransferase n=1 Tax=Catelliglobosispora koreensis TaxID=129052 RepID=UPI000362735B|nr:16S rRNA (uracil(1498)-N(3))-methyltransferase [Catelliglobosispora koreensis]
MSLPLFLVDQLPAGEHFELGGPEGRHAAAVQRLQPGEELLLSDGQGAFATARVQAAGKSSLSLLLTHRGYSESPSPRLVVAQGLPKGDRGELAVQAMTETGVDAIIPWAAQRSVTQWRGDRGDKAREKWASTAREAAKQSRRYRVPPISDLQSTKQLAASLDGPAFVLHEDAKERLSTIGLPEAEVITLIIGPEGGIDDSEIAAFAARGAIPVKLGDTVLRTSTAGVAALSVLSTRLGRW